MQYLIGVNLARVLRKCRCSPKFSGNSGGGPWSIRNGCGNIEWGGKLDFKTIKGYLGEEALMAFYKRGEEVSVLVISAVGAKEKLEVAAVTAADPVNPNYKRTRQDYEGFTLNTITGYPRDFSYAFIGRIGLLALDASLIKETIDIYAGRKSGFTDRYSMSKYLQQQYNASGSTAYIDLPQLTQAVEFDEQVSALFKEITAWTFSNRYEGGHYSLRASADTE